MKKISDLTQNTPWDEEDTLEYEIISGNEIIVFMKAGAGGSARGYRNKYLKMAQRIHERCGATVICASNPDIPHEGADEAKIRSTAASLGFASFRLCLWGTSDGAYKNLLLAKRFPETEKWIGVNSSFITLEDLAARLQSLPQVKKIFIHGTKDEYYDTLFPALQKSENENFKLLTVEGANHNFSGKLPQFIQTIDFALPEE